jgi:hypothetical protein
MVDNQTANKIAKLLKKGEKKKERKTSPVQEQ